MVRGSGVLGGCNCQEGSLGSGRACIERAFEIDSVARKNLYLFVAGK